MKRLMVVMLAVLALVALAAPSAFAEAKPDKTNAKVIILPGPKITAPDASIMACSNTPQFTTGHYSTSYFTWVQFDTAVNTVNHAILVHVNFDSGSAAADVRITDGNGHYWGNGNGYITLNSASPEVTIAVDPTRCGPYYVQVSSDSTFNNTSGTLTVKAL